MWDIIFDPTVPGVFQSPYQRAPLDFGSKLFYYRRETKILKRLHQIQQMDEAQIEAEVERIWTNYENISNSVIDWSNIK